jgi:hypothetical protein
MRKLVIVLVAVCALFTFIRDYRGGGMAAPQAQAAMENPYSP